MVEAKRSGQLVEVRIPIRFKDGKVTGGWEINDPKKTTEMVGSLSEDEKKALLMFWKTSGWGSLEEVAKSMKDVGIVESKIMPTLESLERKELINWRHDEPQLVLMTPRATDVAKELGSMDKIRNGKNLPSAP